MKALTILFRVIFSAILLLAIALYLQVSPTITLGQFCDSLNLDSLCSILGGINTVTVSLAIILLLGIFSCTRILEAAWNILFCASILILLAGGLYAAFGPSVALPNAIYHNECVNQACMALFSYQVPLALTVLVFITGWLCAPASVRVTITAVISYGLWYGVTELFSYMVYLWASSSEPAMPEALNMIQSTPWVLAAVPAAFFLIYALLMAFFETFITHDPAKQPQAKATPKTDDKPAEDAKVEEAPKAEETPAKEPKAEEEASKSEETPAKEPKAVEEAPKPEETPAEEPKAVEEASKPEETPAEEPKAVEEASKPEETPAEEPKAEEEAPKPEETPAEEPKAEEEASKPEETPAEEPKAEEEEKA